MKNLNRALRMALKYRWSIAGSFVCSLMVAALWGANLGAVGPFVEVVMQNKTFHQWADERIEECDILIEKSESKVQGIETSLAELEQQNPQSPQIAKLKAQRTGLQHDIELQDQVRQSTLGLQPYITKYAPKNAFQTLCYLMAFMFTGTIFRGLALMGNMVLVARVGQRTILDIQNQVFENVLNMEVSELGVKGTGDLISRIRGETNAIGQAIMTLFGKTVREPMKMAACLAGAAWVNWRLLIFSMLVCPIAVFLMLKLARLIKRANKKAIEESARLLNRLYQALTYLRVVKAFTMEESERQRFKVVAHDVYKKAMRISVYNALSRMNTELLGVSMISLSVLAGGYLVMNQTSYLFGIRMSSTPMHISHVLMFFGFLIGIADPLRKMADVYNMIQSGVVAADRVFPLMDQIPAVQSPATPTPMPTNQFDIEINDVTFAYEQDKQILNGMSVSIPHGTSLAIVGHNGCGKSTLINLLPRFFDVDSGAIKIGGVDTRELNVQELRQKIGYVTQLTMLFNESIGENISYGSPDATESQIVAAAKKAHALSFVNQLEDGFESSIGEHGGKLSGGQRQRLSLARAILKDPKILILDEATSQIDPESAVLIRQTLGEFMKGRTSIIVTHRLDTLDLVDRILVMREGRAVDCGTHEQLMARCADYRRLRQMDLEGAA